jgi:succinate dehydrogenase / fumarate reductase cytochrome b subunit
MAKPPPSWYHACATSHLSGDALPRALTLLRTLVGKKVLMAVSGVVLLLFVVGHMLGNLKVFQGPEHFNAYAEGLRTVGAPFFGRGQLLWVVRAVVIVAALVHIWSAWLVTRASWAARPDRYQHALRQIETTYAARTMRWGGIIIILYVVYHLTDLTFGGANPAFVPGDVYHNLVASFQRTPVALAYIVANLAVGLHVLHGLWSAGQTLGLEPRPVDRLRRGFAGTVAAALTLGYVIVPVAVMAGWVR